jgi:hypothetical protein
MGVIFSALSRQAMGPIHPPVYGNRVSLPGVKAAPGVTLTTHPILDPLQDGRSQVQFPTVSLLFFIDIILPAALMALGSTQPLTKMEGGVKEAGA